jgi:hypothetical protein
LILYTRANDATGTNWPAPVSLDPDTNSMVNFSYPALEIVNGNPAIAYGFTGLTVGADTLKGIRYISATNAAGGEWNLPVMVVTEDDATDPFMRDLELFNANGRPVIGYMYEVYPDEENSTGYLVCGADSAGASWNAPEIMCGRGHATSGVKGTSVLAEGDVLKWMEWELLDFGAGGLLLGIPIIEYADGRSGGELLVAPVLAGGGINWAADAVMLGDFRQEDGFTHESSAAGDKQASCWCSADYSECTGKAENNESKAPGDVTLWFITSGYPHDGTSVQAYAATMTFPASMFGF